MSMDDDEAARQARRSVLLGRVSWLEGVRRADPDGWDPDDCYHGADVLLAWRTLRDGRGQWQYQCLECGLPISRPVSAALSESLEREGERRGPFDVELHAAGREFLRARAARRSDVARDYGAYLRSPEWKARRVRAIEAAKGRCQRCLTASATQVHHRTYIRAGGEHPEDLEALCAACHRREHESEQ